MTPPTPSTASVEAVRAVLPCQGRRFTDEDGVQHEMKCADAVVPCRNCQTLALVLPVLDQQLAQARAEMPVVQMTDEQFREVVLRVQAEERERCEAEVTRVFHALEVTLETKLLIPPGVRASMSGEVAEYRLKAAAAIRALTP